MLSAGLARPGASNPPRAMILLKALHVQRMSSIFIASDTYKVMLATILAVLELATTRSRLTKPSKPLQPMLTGCLSVLRICIDNTLPRYVTRLLLVNGL